MPTARPRFEGDSLRLSLALLGIVLMIALVGLGFDGNWPKVLRVAAAGGTYAATLLVVTPRGATRSWWRFAVAAGFAGVASGLQRPEPGAVSISIDVGAATVVATAHWLALGLSETIRRKLTT